MYENFNGSTTDLSGSKGYITMGRTIDSIMEEKSITNTFDLTTTEFNTSQSTRRENSSTVTTTQETLAYSSTQTSGPTTDRNSTRMQKSNTTHKGNLRKNDGKSIPTSTTKEDPSTRITTFNCLRIPKRNPASDRFTNHHLSL